MRLCHDYTVNIYNRVSNHLIPKDCVSTELCNSTVQLIMTHCSDM